MGHRKFGFHMIVDSERVGAWPLTFFSTRDDPMWIDPQDTESWVALGPVPGMLTAFSGDEVSTIRALGSSVALFDVWGRGESALRKFLDSCVDDSAVLLQTTSNTLRRPSEIELAELF